MHAGGPGGGAAAPSAAGVLYGVGVGPGDPDLITVRGRRILRRVSVVAWPAPLEGASRARAIAAPHLEGEKPHEIPMRMPMAADRFPARAVYRRAAREIMGHLAAGRDVAALCEGDPFLYGSFMYLFGLLAGLCRIEVVPGVSSLTAAAAAAMAPLAGRGDTLSVVPATLPDAALAARLATAEGLALVKVGRHLGRVRRLLKAAGLLKRAVFVAHASLPEQQVTPLAEVTAEAGPYFSMILVPGRRTAWRTDDGASG